MFNYLHTSAFYVAHKNITYFIFQIIRYNENNTHYHLTFMPDSKLNLQWNLNLSFGVRTMYNKM